MSGVLHSDNAMLAAYLYHAGWRPVPAGWRRVHPSFEVILPASAIAGGYDPRHPERFVDFVRGWELEVAGQLQTRSFTWSQDVTA